MYFMMIDPKVCPLECTKFSLRFDLVTYFLTRYDLVSKLASCYRDKHFGKLSCRFNLNYAPQGIQNGVLRFDLVTYFRPDKKKEIIILHSTKAHERSRTQQNGSQSESTIETSGCV